MNIVFIGSGKAGTSLAKILSESEKFTVSAVTSIIYEEAELSAKFIGSTKYYGTDNFKAVGYGDIIFITTPDDTIEQVCNQIAENCDIKGKFIFHISGSRPSTILSSAEKMGAFIGSIHPLQALPSFEVGSRLLKNSYFCIEGSEKASKIAVDIVDSISGNYFTIKTEFKPLYHAAAVFSSNYINTVCFAAYKIFKDIGVEGEIHKILSPIFKGTVDNISQLGFIESLTGPIERGDINTVRRHLESIKRVSPDILNIYKELGLVTTEIALNKKNQKNKKNINQIKDFLQQN